MAGIVFVGAGQRFADVARENGVSTRDLLEANPQIKRGKDGRYHAEAGQVVFLPPQPADANRLGGSNLLTFNDADMAAINEAEARDKSVPDGRDPIKPDANRLGGSNLLTFNDADMAVINEAEARGKIVPDGKDPIAAAMFAPERREAESRIRAAAARHEFNSTQRFVVGAKVTIPELRVNYRDTEGCWGQPEKNYDIYRNVPGTVAEVKQENGEFVYKVRIDEGVKVEYGQTRQGRIVRSSEGDRAGARHDIVTGSGFGGGLLGSLARKTGVGAGVGIVGGLIYTELVVGKTPIGGLFDLKATDLEAVSEK